ncbi:MAG: TrmH family RNA methyltransferase [Bacteroidetes bacterium]|nr:MAG: TrmH family RNA methyltransferase [Bacteroidota bacterium]
MDQLTLDLIEHMSECVTEKRLALFKQVLVERTRYITVLLEDIYQSQNASAVLRTCDCTGIQDVHIVEERNEYEINRDVALGADQWLSLNYYNEGKNNIYRAIETLKDKGYRIVATSPHKDGVSPEHFDLQKGKAALMFGTELNGLSEGALELADEYIQIPMAGFTESYNISVSAAITLYTLRKRLEVSSLKWKICEEEQSELLLNWLRGTIKMSDQIENKFIRDYQSDF